MVDPLSVSSLAITIVGICGTVGNYINTVQTTDAFLDTLGIEVSQLSTVLYSLSAQFKNLADRRRVLSADAINTEPYWVLVKQSLQGCEVSLKRLRGLLQNLNRSHGFINGALVRLRLGKQAPEIDMYKQQIVSYREALKLALHLISVFTAERSAEGIAKISSQLDTIASRINSILEQLRHGPHPPSLESERVVETIDNYARNAAESITTSDVERSNPMTPTRRDSQTSEYSKIDRFWEIGREGFESQNYQKAEQYLKKAYTKSINTSTKIEFGEELMNLLVISHCKMEHFDEAEFIVLEDLKEKITVDPKGVAIEGKRDLVDILLAMYWAAQRWNDGIKVLREVIRRKEENQVSVYDSQRTLAETYLRMGDIETAMIHCSTIIDPRPSAVDSVFHEATLLMVLICRAKGEGVDAVDYTLDLPEEYKEILEIDQLCLMLKQQEALLAALKGPLQAAIPKEEARKWEALATSTSKDSSLTTQSYQLLLLQVFVCFGTTHHVRRLLDKWMFSEVVNHPLWRQGQTLLMDASIRGRHEMISLLIEFGAAVNQTNSTGGAALHCVVCSNHPVTRVAEILIECGASLELKTKEGYTALKFAKKRKNTDLVRLLEVKSPEKPSDTSPWWWLRSGRGRGAGQGKGG